MDHTNCLHQRHCCVGLWYRDIVALHLCVFCSESDQWRSDGYLSPLTEHFQGSLPFSEFLIVKSAATCIMFCPCVCLSVCVCMKQLGSHWMGFCEVPCCGLLTKICQENSCLATFQQKYRHFPSWLFQLLMLPWLPLTVISNNKYWSVIIDTSLPDFFMWFTKQTIKDNKSCKHSIFYLLCVGIWNVLCM